MAAFFPRHKTLYGDVIVGDRFRRGSAGWGYACECVWWCCVLQCRIAAQCTKGWAELLGEGVNLAGPQAQVGW